MALTEKEAEAMKGKNDFLGKCVGIVLSAVALAAVGLILFAVAPLLF